MFMFIKDTGKVDERHATTSEYCTWSTGEFSAQKSRLLALQAAKIEPRI